MPTIQLSVLDEDRALHELAPLPLARAIVAALSAEPETLVELQAALARFREPPGDQWFDRWKSGVSLEPGEAGTCLIDLAGRVVLSQSPALRVASHGFVVFGQAAADNAPRIWFELAEDWLLEGEIADWHSITEQRRHARRQIPRADHRIVLYDRVSEFLVQQSLAAVAKMQQLSRREWKERCEQEIREIHARWLTTPRDDLQGATPRDVLLAKREWIDFDLRSRCDQWSLTGSCPPGLDHSTTAYKYAGFGSHENIMYYDLLRHLLDALWHRLRESSSLDGAQETQRLREARDAWLTEPHPEMGSSHTPAEVIDLERARIPLAESGDEAMVDCDCPLCQMMAEEGPVFVHFDGCHMDDDFAFSLHCDRSEWEAEQAEFEACAASDALPAKPAAVDRDQEVWQRTLLPSVAEGRLPMTPELQLIGIAGCLAELGVDLKEQGQIERTRLLNRHFSNLREVVAQSSEALLEPAAQRLSAELLETGLEFPTLSEKCSALHRQLTQFVNALLV